MLFNPAMIFCLLYIAMLRHHCIERLHFAALGMLLLFCDHFANVLGGASTQLPSVFVLLDELRAFAGRNKVEGGFLWDEGALGVFGVFERFLENLVQALSVGEVLHKHGVLRARCPSYWLAVKLENS
jgi:hypothetical protein